MRWCRERRVVRRRYLEAYELGLGLGLGLGAVLIAEQRPDTDRHERRNTRSRERDRDDAPASPGWPRNRGSFRRLTPALDLASWLGNAPGAVRLSRSSLVDLGSRDVRRHRSHHFNRRDELIAPPRNGGDEFTHLGVFSQRASEHRNRLREVGLLDNHIGPYRLEQLSLLDEAPAVLDQIDQDVEDLAVRATGWALSVERRDRRSGSSSNPPNR